MRIALLALAILVPVTSVDGGGRVSFTWLDQSFNALDLTPDGKYVVGSAANGTYIWSLDDGYRFIPGGNGASISDDGTVVLGTMPDPEDGVEVAGIWTEATGWQSLGWLPDALNCPSRSNGYELSADGTVAVGLSWDGCSGRGFIWTEATGMQELEPLANGGNRSSVVSADGTIVAGFAQGSGSRTPARWDGSTLAGLLLDPPNGDVTGEVRGISDDGTILLGNWNGSAFYTGAEGVVTFPTLFASWVGAAMDISDGGTIVGFDFLSTSTQAWIKLPDQPTRNLPGYLQDIGLEGGPTNLHVAQAISRNGRVIIGHNTFQSGWIIHIGPDLDLDGNGSIGFGDLLIVLSEWGPCGQPCPADVDEDGAVGFGDLLEILSNWG